MNTYNITNETLPVVNGEYDRKAKTMSYELPSGLQGDSTGEFHFNKTLEQYEHIATDVDGKEYVVISR